MPRRICFWVSVANQDVASELECTPQTVSKWRNRFAQLRLDGLLDAPRPGAPRTLDDARIDAVIVTSKDTGGCNLQLQGTGDGRGGTCPGDSAGPVFLGSFASTFVVSVT